MHINKQLISWLFNINCLDYFSKREFDRSVNIKAFLNCDTDERFFTSSGSMFQQAIRLTKNCFFKTFDLHIGLHSWSLSRKRVNLTFCLTSNTSDGLKLVSPLQILY